MSDLALGPMRSMGIDSQAKACARGLGPTTLETTKQEAGAQ
jgi:hypothetical protein